MIRGSVHPTLGFRNPRVPRVSAPPSSASCLLHTEARLRFAPKHDLSLLRFLQGMPTFSRRAVMRCFTWRRNSQTWCPPMGTSACYLQMLDAYPVWMLPRRCDLSSQRNEGVSSCCTLYLYTCEMKIPRPFSSTAGIVPYRYSEALLPVQQKTLSLVPLVGSCILSLRATIVMESAIFRANIFFASREPQFANFEYEGGSHRRQQVYLL